MARRRSLGGFSRLIQHDNIELRSTNIGERNAHNTLIGIFTTTAGRRVADLNERGKRHPKNVLLGELAVLAVAMLIINILQALLIDRLHNIGWILGFPLAVFGVLMMLLLAHSFYNRHAILSLWQEHKRSERLAWVGVVLSIMLPIVACEFLYMNLVALPAWNTIIWTTSVHSNNTIVPPAVVIFNETPDVVMLNSEQLRCSVYSSQESSNCSMEPIENSVVPSGYQYTVFNSSARTAETASGTVTFNGPSDFLSLFTSTSYKGDNISIGPDYLTYSLFDPSLKLSLTTMLWACGNPPLYSSFVAPAFGIALVRVEAFIMDDAAGALFQSAEKACPSSEYGTGPSKFTYYTATAETFPYSNTTLCTAEEVEHGEVCTSTLRLSMTSSLVQTQRSHHGTSALKILIDEGSILGAVLFITWFFGIFAV